jgi:hypothetical protein
MPPLLFVFTLRRESLTDQASAKLTPDSQKSTTGQISDTVKGKTDQALSHAQPGNAFLCYAPIPSTVTGVCFGRNEQLADFECFCSVSIEDTKSSGQKLGDTARHGANATEDSSKGVVESTQNTLSDAAKSASDTLNAAGESSTPHTHTHTHTLSLSLHPLVSLRLKCVCLAL